MLWVATLKSRLEDRNVLNTINAIGWAIFKLKLNRFLLHLFRDRILIIFGSKLHWWLIRYIWDYIDEVLKNVIWAVLMFWEWHPIIILNIWSLQESGWPHVDADPKHTRVPPSSLFTQYSFVLHFAFYYHDFIVPYGHKSIFFSNWAFLVLGRVINLRICHFKVLITLFFDDH